MKQNQVIEAYWQKFLTDTGRDETTKYYDSFHFCMDEKNANELLALVLQGKKTATSSSVYAYEKENEELPKAGDLSIVTDFAGKPHCVIETKTVTVLPFKEMTYEICKREGEDDNLESWQNNHIKFFTEDAAALGYVFDGDMPVIFEDFVVIYK